MSKKKANKNSKLNWKEIFKEIPTLEEPKFSEKQLRKKRFTYNQVQEILNKAQRITSQSILDDIEWGQKKKYIASKLKNGNYAEDSLLGVYYDLMEELEKK